MNWYVLKCYSGKEKKVREAILLEAERAGMKDMITEVLVPSENIMEMREGKKRVRNKVFFPGYILVQMEITKESQYLVENIPGVMSFVGAKGKPLPLKPEEIRRVMGEVEKKDGREGMATPFKMGDPVKVVDGPFVDFRGVVQEINDDKQKLKVMVSIFGRPTPVELDYLQVELEK
ncbi:MAG: transcription termination/antitermination factor NusG [Candidatus Neomarinimicrobiota bacterium]|nr:MAG: transcription termination/antitermination factor NusG [Candidatus Neomarinimicrobiota bacterium]